MLSNSNLKAMILIKKLKIFIYLLFIFCFLEVQSQEKILNLNKIELDEFNLDGIVSNAEINGAKILEVKYEEQPGYNTAPTQRTIAFITYSSKL